MDKIMSMVNQVAEGGAAQFVEMMKEALHSSLAPTVTGIVLGLVICFFGLKLIRVLAAITGIFVGIILGAVFSWIFALQGGAFLGAMAVGAVLFACFGAIIRRVGGFLFIGALTTGAMELLLMPQSLPFHLICVGVGLVLAIITAILMDPLLIVISSIWGGVMAGHAAFELAGVDVNVLVVYGACAALAVLGMIVQFMMKSREVGRKEKRFSQSVKEEKSVETEVEKARMLLDGDLPEEPDDEEPDSGEPGEDPDDEDLEIMYLDDEDPDEEPRKEK